MSSPALQPRRPPPDGAEPEPRTPGASPAAAPDGGLLQEELRSLAHDLGFQGGIYLHLGHAVRDLAQARPVQPLRFVASSICDRRLYLEAGLWALVPSNDPLTHGPSAWTTGTGAGPGEIAAPLRRSLRDRGVQGGVLIPIHDYAAGPAYLNLYSLYADEAERHARENGPVLVFAAGRFHARAKALASTARTEACAPLLTPREIDCLRLAALGLTGQETALALDVAARTVEFHLKNAVEKFGASNKVRAVALAVRQGLIEP